MHTTIHDLNAMPYVPLSFAQALTELPLAPVARPTYEHCAFETLVDDVLIAIVGVLCVRDILNVRLTSKRLETITRLGAVWRAIFHREVVSRGRPVPGHPYLPFKKGLDLDSNNSVVSVMRAGSLEHHTHLAVRLAKRWIRPRPAPSYSFQLSVRDAAQGFTSVNDTANVEDVFLLNGGTRLVTVHRSALVLWDLVMPGIQPKTSYLNTKVCATWPMPLEGCFAILDSEYKELPGGVKAGDGARIAISAKEGLITMLHVSPNTTRTLHTESMPFHVVSRLRVEGLLVYMHAHILAYTRSDESGHLGVELIDWTAPEGKSSRALLFEPNTELGKFVDMCIYTPSTSGKLATSQFVVVVWEFNIGVYRLPEVLQRPWSEVDSVEMDLCGRAILVAPQIVFGLNEQVTKPVAFTSCRTGHYTPSYVDDSSLLEHARLSPLTILARPIRHGAGLMQTALQPILINVKTKGHGNSLPRERSLTLGPVHDHEYEKQVHFRIMRSSPPHSEGPCVALALGMSGRGIRAELVTATRQPAADLISPEASTRSRQSVALYRCVPSPVLSPFGLLDSTVDFYPNQAMHTFPMEQGNSPITTSGGELGTQGHNADPTSAGEVSDFIMRFDEGVGRLVAVRKRSGDISVIDFC